MYIIDTLYYLYKSTKRRSLIDISKHLSHGNFVKQGFIIMDMIYCSLVYGAMFTEYGDLGFKFRKRSNRKTYLTTFYNFKLYDKVNKREKRKIFHNKKLFLQKFSKYINRDWLDLSNCTKEDVESFICGKKAVVLKSCMGDSGNNVCVVDSDKFESINSFLSFVRDNNYDLVEECLYNCIELQKLNYSSLNTLRITTLVIDGVVNILFAGLRVGAKGAKIDNISQGGFVAKIDIDSGKICSEFYQKRSSMSVESRMDSCIGFQIPRWEQVISLIKQLAIVEEDVQFVSWDVCITPSGPEVIEGNESFGSVILQVFNSYNECGLKPLVEGLFHKASE